MLPPVHFYCPVTDVYSVTEFGPAQCRGIFLFKICYVTDMEAQKSLLSRKRDRERDTTFLILLLKYELFLVLFYFNENYSTCRCLKESAACLNLLATDCFFQILAHLYLKCE